MDRFLRHGAPLILLGIALVVWLEPWLPGREWIAESFGSDAVLRFATGAIAVYAAVLVFERQQMAGLFRQVLEQFKRFHEAQGRLRADDGDVAKAEAVRILASALRSDDAAVRDSARANLRRLCGTDLGDDPAAWQAHVDEHFPRS